MTLNGWLQILFFLLAVFVVTPPLGAFMARVFAGQRTFLDPVMRPIERLIYRLTGVDERRGMRWTEYSVALLLFSVVSLVVLYAMQRLQSLLPWNPQGFSGVAPDLAFNTAVSFTTNTNWQAYSGESTMSYFTQMAGLAYHNFVSAAAGIAVAIAFIRGIAQKETDTIGNFWVDLVRASLWVLLPIAVVGSLFLVSQGVVQNLKPTTPCRPSKARKQVIAQGPVASQEVIKQFGTNGGGFFNANSAHPVREPDAAHELPGDVRHLRDLRGADLHVRHDDRVAPPRLGDLGGDGGAVPGGVTVAYWAEPAGNPMLAAAGADQTRDGDVAGRQHGRQGSPLRHREHRAVRHGDHRRELRRRQRLARLVHAARRPGAARQHAAERGHLRRRRARDVRHPGLRHPRGLHRRPDGRADAGIPRQEDRGVRGEDGDADAADLLAGDPDLHRRSPSVSPDFGTSSIFNPGPHGLSEILYAYSSAAGNNGSAFGGLSANTPWYNTTLGLAMLFGRFLMIIPLLAIAGSLAARSGFRRRSGRSR